MFSRYNELDIYIFTNPFTYVYAILCWCICNCFRLWAREPDTLSLFTVTTTTPHSEIALTRDPLTGAHMGFCEVWLLAT